MTRRAIALLLALAMGVALMPGATAASASGRWTVTRISNTYHDQSPRVSGDRVVWRGHEGSDWEIYTWAAGDAAPTNISNNGQDDANPQISGSRVVWEGFDGNDWEIYMWTAGDAAPVNISDRDGFDDYDPEISGDRVVWEGYDPAGVLEVYTWVVGDAAPAQLTDNAISDFDPRVSGNRVVWMTWDGADGEIYTWAAGDVAPVNISERPGLYDANPQISGSRVVWDGYDGNDNEVYTWAVGDSAPVNISNRDGLDDSGPQISGNRVAWDGYDGNDYEVYTWAVGDVAPANISNNNGRSDGVSHVSGDRVVWEGFDGNDEEIFTWAAGDVAPANVSGADGLEDGAPQVSGDRIVWEGRINDDWKIFTAVPPVTIALEDQAAGVVFDRWVTGFSGSYSGGTYVYGRWTGTNLDAKFTGHAVRWIGPKQPGYGKADVYVDGAFAATVDCYAAAPDATYSTTLWESPTLTGGLHTVSIRLNGASNPASTGSVVVLDHFEVDGAAPSGVGSRLNEQGSHATFSGTWIKAVNPTYTSSTYAYSRWAGTSYKASFTGTKVAWIGPKVNSYGYANVYLDGAFKGTVDCYAPTTATGWRYKIWESGALSPGAHYIQIKPTGTKRAASTNTVVVVDALDVSP